MGKSQDLSSARNSVVIRRLISKICAEYIRPDILQYFQPVQLGVGVSGGAEALLHAFYRVTQAEDFDNKLLLVLVDFENAFNELKR